MSRDRRVGWIDMIGIRPNSQQRGIGRALVEAFQNECRRNNATMRAVIREDDERHKNFTVALGFKKWEVAAYEKEQ
ncbi:GNAT family N-acetyltransferase [Chloroflexota bacterium]